MPRVNSFIGPNYRFDGDLMGMRMGFLAFLLIGSAVGWSAYYFYPGRSRQKQGLLGHCSLFMVGFLGAAAGSFGGQALGLFQSGQIAEWLTAIGSAWLASLLLTVIRK
jgi:uncharacterized membrane protein YeaQ/YmgE (transglycosylase-associated protein family)